MCWLRSSWGAAGWGGGREEAGKWGGGRQKGATGECVREKERERSAAGLDASKVGRGVAQRRPLGVEAASAHQEVRDLQRMLLLVGHLGQLLH